MSESGETHDDEELVRTFFDLAPIGRAITAPDGSWQRVNATLAAMLGYSVEELRALPETVPADYYPSDFRH